MKTKASPPTKTDPGPRFLAYALPRARNDNESKVKTYDGFVLHDEPLGSSVSFLDFDGIALLAGAFERVHSNMMDSPRVVCASLSDLDLREREFYSAVQRGKPVIFLVSRLAHVVGFSEVNPQHDLFRRFANGFNLRWACREQPSPLVES